MRIRTAKAITVFVIILNFIALYFIWKLISKHGRSKTSFRQNAINNVTVNDKVFRKGPKRTHQNEVTFVMRSFEAFDNDVAETVKSILNVYPNTSILIVCDNTLYPPIILNSSVKFIYLKTSLTNSFRDRTPALKITTKYTFFIPDSTRFNSRKLLDKLMNISINHPGKLIAVPYKGPRVIKCLNIQLEIREWQIRFYEYPQEVQECDYVKGKHALFVESAVLLNVSDPFLLPFPDSLYIQSSFNKVKVS